MGWLSLLVPQTTPFMSWFNGSQNAVHGLGAGIAQGDTLSEGLGLGAQYAAQGAQKDSDYAIAAKKEAQRQADLQKAQDWLKTAFPKYAALPADVGMDLAKTTLEQQLKAPSDQADTASGRALLADQYGLTGTDKTTFVLTGKVPGGNQTARAGVGQPIPFRNKKTGELVGAQPMTVGPAVNTITGQPFENPDDWIYDPQALAQARASGAAFGTAGGTSAAGLSAAAMKAEQALGVIQNLRGLNEDGTPNDRYAQGRKDTFGTYGVGPLQIPDQWGFTMPGSAKADYASLLSQAGGQQFLTAYQGLRGTGAISEAEGAQAKDAVARMSTAQSDQAFQDALSDYERIIRKGYEVEKQKASSVGYGTDAAAPLPSGTGTVLTYNPVTGNLE